MRIKTISYEVYVRADVLIRISLHARSDIDYDNVRLTVSTSLLVCWGLQAINWKKKQCYVGSLRSNAACMKTRTLDDIGPVLTIVYQLDLVILIIEPVRTDCMFIRWGIQYYYVPQRVYKPTTRYIRISICIIIITSDNVFSDLMSVRYVSCLSSLVVSKQSHMKS